MKNKKVTLLLTACINPGGMSYTALQDPLQRQEQYVQALTFYLEKTKSRVVFVENTNTDLSHLFRSYIQAGRLEYLTFDGNHHPKHLGKGYGEVKIMEHALLHSEFVRESDYVVKITGRLIVANINEIVDSFLLKCHKACLRFDFCSTDSMFTMCFVCPPQWLAAHIVPYIDQMDDSKGVYMEHLFYRRIRDARPSLPLYPFITPPLIEGVSGSTLTRYVVKSASANLADNLYCLTALWDERAKRVGNVCLRSLCRALLALLRVTSKAVRKVLFLMRGRRG